MRIGVPTELKADENRVGLTPAGARELSAQGHAIMVESGAGGGQRLRRRALQGSGRNDLQCRSGLGRGRARSQGQGAAGRRVRPAATRSSLFTYLHLAADRELTEALVASGATCIAYETVQLDGGPAAAARADERSRRPACGADGRLGARKHQGGRGVLLGGIPGVVPARVVVIGGGTVGSNAALIALGMHADVLVLERSVARMRHLELLLDGRMRLAMSNRQQVEESIASADLVIGAVLVPVPGRRCS